MPVTPFTLNHGQLGLATDVVMYTVPSTGNATLQYFSLTNINTNTNINFNLTISGGGIKSEWRHSVPLISGETIEWDGILPLSTNYKILGNVSPSGADFILGGMEFI